MITPIFNNTILILNESILKYDVPYFDIRVIEMSRFLSEDIDREVLRQMLASPILYGLRSIASDGRRVYLSNGIVTWINSNTEDFVAAHSGMEWDDDIKLLKSCGLKFGKDMVMIQFDDYQFYTVDEKHYPVKCNWTKCILKNFNQTYLWVGEGSKFNCNSILGFKSEGVL